MHWHRCQCIVQLNDFDTKSYDILLTSISPGVLLLSYAYARIEFCNEICFRYDFTQLLIELKQIYSTFWSVCRTGATKFKFLGPQIVDFLVLFFRALLCTESLICESSVKRNISNQGSKWVFSKKLGKVETSVTFTSAYSTIGSWKLGKTRNS